MTRFRLLAAALAAAMLAPSLYANDTPAGASDRAPKLAAAPKLTAQKADTAPAPKLVSKTAAAEPAAGIVAPAAAVVTVNVPTAPGNGYAGSGVVVWCENGKSYVVTNYHVLEDNRGMFSVTVNSTQKTYPARVLNRSAEGDAALLEVAGELPAVALGTDPEPGTSVTHYGNATGPQRGKVTGYREVWHADWHGYNLHTDCLSHAGDSGAAVANDRGELVAVHWGGPNRDQFGRLVAGERSAAPVGVVRRLLRDVLANRLPRLAARLADDAPPAVPAPPVNVAAQPASLKSAPNCPCPAVGGDCAVGKCAPGCGPCAPAAAGSVTAYRVGNGPWMTPDQYRAAYPQHVAGTPLAASGTSCAGGVCRPTAGAPVYYFAPAGSPCANGRCPTPSR